MRKRPAGLLTGGDGRPRRRAVRRQDAPGAPDAAKAEAAPWLKCARGSVDKHSWEFSPAATEFARQLHRLLHKEADANLWVFELGVTLTEQQHINGTTLFVREYHRKLWDAILRIREKGVRKIAMIGNPGIGKSRNWIYGLWLLMRGCGPPPGAAAAGSSVGAAPAGELPVIIYELCNDRKVFAFVPPGKDLVDGVPTLDWQVYQIQRRHFDAAACMALSSCKNYYLIDPADADQCPATVSACTIIACSPDPKHYKEWAKNADCRAMYVTPYSASETEAALPYVEFDDANELHSMSPQERLNKVLARFHDVGGIVRVLFGPETVYRSHLNNRGVQLKTFDTVKNVILGEMLEQSSNFMPTYLFKYVPKETDDEVNPHSAFTVIDLKTDWVSEGAKQAAMTRYYNEMMQEFSAIHVGASIQQAKGSYFEKFCGWLLAGGGQAVGLTHLKWHDLQKKNTARFDLPQKKLRHMSNTDEMDKQLEAAQNVSELDNILYVPDKNYPGFDFLVSPRHGVNATLQETGHSIASTMLEKLKRLNIEHFQLSYMIPASKDKFGVKAADLKEAQNIVKVRMLKVPLRLDSGPGASNQPG